MLSMIWPIALAVASNIIYHICAKSVPDALDPLASLTVTYLIAAATSAVLFFSLHRGGNLLREVSRVNWASVVLGVVIVGLEVGFIYAYKVGWAVGAASVVQSCFLAVALLIVGYVLYREQVSLTKVMGMVICLVGLYFLNK